MRVFGTTVGEIIASLDAQCPGIGDRLVVAGELVSELAVSVDGELGQSGIRTKVGADSEVYFLPAMSGG